MAQPAHATSNRITNEPLCGGPLLALTELEEFLRVRRGAGAMTSFGDFEKALHAKVMGLEREIAEEELERADLNVPAIVIEGQVYKQVLRAEESYQTATGEVRVMRFLYKDRTDKGARVVVPMEYRLGLIEGRWTPLAAQEAAWVVAQMTPKRDAPLPSTSASTFTWARRAYLLTVDGFALARDNIMPMIREYNSWKVGGLVTLGVVVLLAVIYFALVMPVGLRPM